MTPQERAAALLERMGLCGHPAASQFVGDIIEHDQQTRRAALLEAAEVAEKRKNDSALGRVRDAYSYVEANLRKLAQEG